MSSGAEGFQSWNLQPIEITQDRETQWKGGPRGEIRSEGHTVQNIVSRVEDGILPNLSLYIFL